MNRLYRYTAIALVLAVMLIPPISQAQANTLTYGSTVNHDISATTPQRFYAFNGAAGDLVTAYVLSWQDNVQFSIALTSTTGQLAFSTSDPLTPITNDSRVSYRLPADGVYTLIINSLSGEGSYTLALRRTQPSVSTTLQGTTQITIPQGAPTQTYSVLSDATTPTSINISSLSSGFAFQAAVRNMNGEIIAVIVDEIEMANLVLPTGTGTYELSITAADPTITGTIEIALRTGTTATDTNTQASSTPQNTTTQNAGNACILQANGVNLRSGPGTNYGVVGGLNGDATATGQNNGWYTLYYNGSTAWVYSGVVTVAGACNNLVYVDAPAPPPSVTEEVSNTNNQSNNNGQSNNNNQNNNNQNTNQQPTAVPTSVPATATPPPSIAVNSFSCTWLQNDGATVRWDITGTPDEVFLVEVRSGSTRYNEQRTVPSSGSYSGQKRFGQAGNSNYRAYLVYNGADLANADC